MVISTRFFADPELFEAVKQNVSPCLFDDRGHSGGIRVWSVGCATGEETYSLVILLLEEAARRSARHPLKVFASDRDAHALQRAREGFYRGNIENEVAPERLERFFYREHGGFRIRKEIRELVTFASHDLLTDPPFPRLDCIWCRDFSLALGETELQQATRKFYYALKPEAFLILGSSSSMRVPTPWFRLEDERHPIYHRSEAPMAIPDREILPMARHTRPPPLRSQSPPSPLPYELFHLRVLEQYSPPSLLVTPDDQVAHISKEAGRYLHHEAGALTSGVFQLVHHELRHALEDLLVLARTQHRAVRSEPLRVAIGEATSTVTLEAKPARVPDQQGFVLVAFEEAHAIDTRESLDDGEPLESLDRAQLRTRLRAHEAEQLQLQDRLRAFQHEREATEMELQLANEELQSATEELRAVMEEIEIGKEDLQSANDDLETANKELQERALELERLSNDLQHFLAAPDIATIFLDRDLKILRFTPKLSELFNTRASDQGRPLSDITHRLLDEKLQESALEVLQRSTSVEREVQDTQGRWYLSRLLPYRDLQKRVAGVVVNFVDITQRKEAEEAALAAKREAEDILAALPEPLLVFDFDLRIQSANPAFCQHFRIDPEQCTGVRLHDLEAGWENPRLRELLDTVMAQTEVVNGWSVEHDFGDLGRRVLLLNARRLSSKNRILLGIHDITERDRAEQAVRSAAEKLRRMVNIDGVGILTCDRNGTLLDANDAFLAWSGHTRDEIRSGMSSWWTMALPEHTGRMQEQLERLYRCGRLGPFEREVLRRDGLRSWILSAGATLGDGTFVEYCIDITDRKRAEEGLRRSEQQYRTLFESIDEGYCVIEMLFDANEKPIDYRFLEINPIFSKQTGLEDPTGKRMRELVPDHEDEWFEIYGQVAKTGEPVRFQQGAAAMGRFYDVYAFRIGRPEEHKVAVLFNDIGSRKKLEDQLRTFAEELKEANGRKDEYLAMLGHELRNPLAAIRSAVEFLKLIETDEPRLAHAHRAIERQSLHMSRLIDGLLEVSRIARGKVQIDVQPVDLKQILDAVVQDRGAELNTRGLELRTQFCEEPLWVMGDAIRLTQVFDNLLGNAIKFTNAPGRITVLLERQEDSAVIRLQDTGIGIRREQLTRIFEAFHQESPDVARTSGGLGLGLALASGLVALHQGSIHATSAGLGGGSTFEVRLPRTSHSSQPVRAECPRHAVPCKVLIIEDNPDAGEMLLELLELRGHRVRLATNGIEALQELDQERPDIVLCDLGLPGMSGYEIAQSIRKNERLRGLPLVALTGYGQPSDRLRSTEAGFDGHLIKPVNLRELEDLLGRLGHHRQARETEHHSFS